MCKSDHSTVLSSQRGLESWVDFMENGKISEHSLVHKVPEALLLVDYSKLSGFKTVTVGMDR